MMEFETIRLSPALGAEIRGLDLPCPLDGETIAALRSAWLENFVLVFRGQMLDGEAQARFANYFGPVSESPQAPDRLRRKHNPDRRILLVTNIREDGEPIGALPDGELQFHSDSAFLERPLMATVLYALEIPDRGGETLFANVCMAYEALDADLKERLEGRRAFNIYDYSVQVKSGTLDRAGLPQAVHPVVRTHPETGARAVYVNRLMTRRDPGHAASRQRGASGEIVRFRGAPGIRLRACLAQGRPGDLGQPLRPARQARLPGRPDPADAPHRHRRRRAGLNVTNTGVDHATGSSPPCNSGMISRANRRSVSRLSGNSIRTYSNPISRRWRSRWRTASGSPISASEARPRSA